MVKAGLKDRTRDSTVTEITNEIERIFAERQSQAATHGPPFFELWQTTTSCVTGGKLLRPRLLMGVYEALLATDPVDASDRSVAREIASALEILHFSFLLHDDVIDEDLLRRGQPNLIGHLVGNQGESQATGETIHDAAQLRLHWARSSGLLAGDLMLTIAHQIFARARIPENRRIRLLDLLDATVTETVAGEYLDVGFADECITPDLSLVLEMTRMKTATYTFELPLRCAAVLANADHSLEDQLGKIGQHLGVSFQLQDDLLSAFGCSTAHGKDQFSDFREGKETALIAYARVTPVWNTLRPLLGAADFSAESGRTIQRLLVECGAKDFIESMINDHIGRALSALSPEAGAPEPVSQFIRSFVRSLEGRDV